MSMLFYEIRVLISLFVIILFLEKSRMLDSLLKLFLQWYIGYLLKLPIRINACYVNLSNGIFQMSGFQILAPDKTIDPRWYHECILEISFLDVRFYLFDSILSFILTFGYQAYVKNITVDSMKIFIEGYEDPVTGNLSVNMDLIGKGVDTNANKMKVKEPKKKKNKEPTWVTSRNSSSSSSSSNNNNGTSEWEFVNSSVISSTLATPKVTVANAYTSSNTTSKAAVVVNASPVKCITSVPVAPTSPLLPSSPSNPMYGQKNESIFSNFTDIVGNFIKEVDNSGGLESYVQKKSETFTKSIADGSLLQNAKKTIDDALSTAKRKIDEGVNSKITSAHEYLRGGEPVKSQEDLRILGRFLLIRDVQANFRSILPVTLRHLEKKTISAKCIRLALHNPDEVRKDHKSCPVSAGKDSSLNMKKTSSSNLFETWTTVQSFDDEQDNHIHDDDIFIPLDIKTGIHSAILQHQFEREVLFQLVKKDAGSLIFEAIDWDLFHSKEEDDPRLNKKTMRSENPLFLDDDDEE